MDEVFLQPGDVFVGDGRHRMRTLLGSCVSIVLWQPQRRVGAMNHFMLPSRGDRRGMAPDGRYGNEALSLMLRGLDARGVDPSTCVAKLFGGADMFRVPTTSVDSGVGRLNGRAARELLTAHGVNIVAESLFGFSHRRIRFDVSTGQVWMWKGRPVADPGGRRERA